MEVQTMGHNRQITKRVIDEIKNVVNETNKNILSLFWLGIVDLQKFV
jgi:hypothetical protein